jgi:hypothetical protein
MPRCYKRVQSVAVQINKKRSYGIIRTNMFAVHDKVKPDTENIRGLNLAAVKLTTVHVTRLPL